jgi:uncharacterized protein
MFVPHNRNTTQYMAKGLKIPENVPPAFHLLAKPTGAICNLDCAYCFFLDKEEFYPGSQFRMSEELLETYLQQLIDSHQTDQVTIAWQGGEPTMMGLDFFRKAVTLAEKYRRPGMTLEHTLQTNGTLLNDDWCAFFKQNNFLIGISIKAAGRPLIGSCAACACCRNTMLSSTS